MVYFVNADNILIQLNYTNDDKTLFYILNFVLLYNIFGFLLIPYYFLNKPIYLEKRIHITLLASYNFCQALLIMFIHCLFLNISGSMTYFIPVIISSIYVLVLFPMIFYVYRLYTDIYRKSLNIPMADVASPASNVETIENLNL